MIRFGWRRAPAQAPDASLDRRQAAEQRRDARIAAREARRAARREAGPLPDAVLSIIHAAGVHVRSLGSAEDDPSVIVQLPGRTGFRFHPESAERVIASAFPELGETHIEMAVSRLNSLVKAELTHCAREAAERSEPQRDYYGNIIPPPTRNPFY